MPEPDMESMRNFNCLATAQSVAGSPSKLSPQITLVADIDNRCKTTILGKIVEIVAATESNGRFWSHR